MAIVFDYFKKTSMKKVKSLLHSFLVTKLAASLLKLEMP